MKRIAVIISELLLSFVIAVCILLVLSGLYSLEKGRRMYDLFSTRVIDGMNNVISKDDPADTYVYPVDWQSVRNVNPMVCAWISFPTDGELSVINYPVVKAEDEYEDRYYLNHLVDGTYGISGTPETAHWDSEPFRGSSDHNDGYHNTIIFGHAMNDGSMFGSIKILKKQEVFDRNSCFIIYTPPDQSDYHDYSSEWGNYDIYRIISIYETSDAGDDYQFEFTDSEEYGEYIEEIITKSIIKNGVDTIEILNADSDMVSLCTCTNRTERGRLMVNAVRLSQNVGL